MVLDLSHYLTSNIKRGLRERDTAPHSKKGHKRTSNHDCVEQKNEKEIIPKKMCGIAVKA